MITLAEYQRVCDERDQLKEQLAYLLEREQEDGEAAKFRRMREALGVTPSHLHLLLALYEKRTLSRTAISDLLPARDHVAGHTYQVVKVHVRHIREKFGPDIIETVWKGGSRRHGANYRLGSAGVELMRETLAEAA